MTEVNANDKFEIQSELQSGEIVTIEGIATPQYKGSAKIIAECCFLYSREEAERRGMKIKDIPCIDVPIGDLECELSGGFVTFRRGKEIVFMEMRDRIKKTITLINGKVLEES